MVVAVVVAVGFKEAVEVVVPVVAGEVEASVEPD